MPTPKRASKKKPPPKKHWRFVVLRAAVCRTGSLRRSGNVYPTWHVRFGAEVRGVELRSLWRDTLLSVEYPLDTIVRVPTWVGAVEVGYQDARGTWTVVPHESPDTIETEEGATVPVRELSPKTECITL